MNCPACNSALVAIEYRDVEVDYCPDCAGIWLDEGELELLFGERPMAEHFLAAGQTIPLQEKPRRCPLCGRRMIKHTTDGPEPVTWDACPRGEGMWLDKGELHALLEHGSSSPGGAQVAAWLHEVFPR